MALFNLIQDYEDKPDEWHTPTFKNCADADIARAFFNSDEHADLRRVDGKEALVIFEETTLKEHSAHWEAGAKQNFDTGLYKAYSVLYIKADDYGPKPKIGKQLVLSVDESHTRTYEIKNCEEEAGVYRMILERVRQ